MTARWPPLLLILICAACQQAPRWTWDLPEGFPTPSVPETNPMSAEKVELGRHLFHDVRLSGNETQSCATCHVQELAFTDGRAQALGSTGELHSRSAMGLTNVAYNSRLTWANHLMSQLEDQAMVPLFGDVPVEMGLTEEEELLSRLWKDEDYVRLFAEAYPDQPDPISMPNVLQAIASFQRTLLSGDSPYDRYTRGETDAISDSAKRGMRLFFSERLECFHCHGGFNFSDSVDHAGLVEEERAFHNTGLYNVDGEGAYPSSDRGLHELTDRPEDMGAFRAPTLRNLAVTAPFMHDGSIPDLAGVLDHYAAGGRRIESGPNAGDGSANPYKDEFVVGFILNEQEKTDVLAFLETLTDEGFLTDPRFASPFGQSDPGGS
ncbi:MAG: MbnH family di-heme enzyme [Acidobacteriota bacterium]